MRWIVAAPVHRHEQRREHADAVADRRAGDRSRRDRRRFRACIAGPSWRISALIVRCECTTPFGSRRGARRVRDERGRARDRPRRSRRAARRRRGRRTRSRRAAAAVVADDRDPFEIGQRRRASRRGWRGSPGAPKRSAVTSAFTPRLAQDVADFLRPVEVHDRHDDRAEVRDRVEGRRRLEPVRELERDRVAGSDAAGAQPGGDPARERVDVAERAAVRHALGAHRERRRPRRAARRRAAPELWSSQKPSHVRGRRSVSRREVHGSVWHHVDGERCGRRGRRDSALGAVGGVLTGRSSTSPTRVVITDDDVPGSCSPSRAKTSRTRNYSSEAP